jgi:hypothetical protein
MREKANPFEYLPANTFCVDDLLAYYIPDYNYSRSVNSNRNVYFVGERGTGKTMTLLYYSLPFQSRKAQQEGRGDLNLRLVSVYIPCKNPLIFKCDQDFLPKFQAAILSEHFLSLVIVHSVADALGAVPDLLDGVDETALREDLAYATGFALPQKAFFEALKLEAQRLIGEALRAVGRRSSEFYDKAVTFFTAVVPLLSTLRKVPKLADSHFSLMFDDIHDLNEHQIRALNSWIAYRDRSLFSTKATAAKSSRPTMMTAHGGTILEGHDYTLVDLERPYQNRLSEYGKMARLIVERRLVRIGVKKSADEFFPMHQNTLRELEECKKKAEQAAKEKYGRPSRKQVSDYVYKYHRAIYFREREPKANHPVYSGFETLVHLSTGVIRNLLEPCHRMYERAISDKSQRGAPVVIDHIPPSLQAEAIRYVSRQKWSFIETGLDSTILGCSHTQAEQIYRLFDQLAILFRKRLLQHASEPRAIAFAVSDTNYDHYEDLMKLLRTAREAQILYEYTGSAKESGKRQTYYVPNRMLWPERGLDPVGQFSRVYLKSRVLWEAAFAGIEIPMETGESIEGGLFGD